MHEPEAQPQQPHSVTETELGISIENFGPIASGHLDLRPLTILVGPNNAGKSYAAMLVHSLLRNSGKAQAGTDAPSVYTPRPALDFPAGLSQHAQTELEHLADRMHNSAEGRRLSLPQTILNGIWERILEEVYEQRLSKAIEWNYRCEDPSELVRLGQSSFALTVISGSGSTRIEASQDQGMRLRETPSPPQGAKIEVRYSVPETWKLPAPHVFVGRVPPTTYDPELPRKVYNDIAVQCERLIAPAGWPIARYLPAARSGIVQTHRALVPAIIRNEQVELSGVVRDFTASMAELAPKPQSYYEIAEQFEKELTGGEFDVQLMEATNYPRIVYTVEDEEVPLWRSSATVCELAALILYLKYVVQEDSLLIIEEPEAHLHPRNQALLARMLVRLVNNGLNLLLTTHSEFLLAQFSNHILAEHAESRLLERWDDYSEQDRLPADHVRAFHFHKPDEKHGYRIDRLDVSEEEGIDDSEFLQVDQELYDDYFKLRKSIERARD